MRSPTHPVGPGRRRPTPLDAEDTPPTMLAAILLTMCLIGIFYLVRPD